MIQARLIPDISLPDTNPLIVATEGSISPLLAEDDEIEILMRDNSAENRRSVSRSTSFPGFTNYANTCFMNATLQALLNIGHFRNYLLSSSHGDSCDNREYCALCSLIALSNRCYDCRSNNVDPQEIIDGLEAISPNIQYGLQFDAQEFFSYLVSALETAAGGGSFPLNSFDKIFTLYGIRYVRCSSCTIFAYNDVVWKIFRIPIDARDMVSSEPTLESRVAAVLGIEDLDEYRCASCSQITKSYQGMQLRFLPKIICFQLLRFLYTEQGARKLNGKLEYPLNLNMGNFVPPNQDRPSHETPHPFIYSLAAVIVHIGDTAQSGHYFTYAKSASGIWRKFDDTRVNLIHLILHTRSLIMSQVSIVDQTEVLAQTAYLIFYEQSSAAPQLPRTRQKKRKRANRLKPGLYTAAQLSEDFTIAGQPSDIVLKEFSTVSDQKTAQPEAQDVINAEIEDIDQWNPKIISMLNLLPPNNLDSFYLNGINDVLIEWLENLRVKNFEAFCKFVSPALPPFIQGQFLSMKYVDPPCNLAGFGQEEYRDAIKSGLHEIDAPVCGTDIDKFAVTVPTSALSDFTSLPLQIASKLTFELDDLHMFQKNKLHEWILLVDQPIVILIPRNETKNLSFRIALNRYFPTYPNGERVFSNKNHHVDVDILVLTLKMAEIHEIRLLRWGAKSPLEGRLFRSLQVTNVLKFRQSPIGGSIFKVIEKIEPTMVGIDYSYDFFTFGIPLFYQTREKKVQKQSSAEGRSYLAKKYKRRGTLPMLGCIGMGCFGSVMSPLPVFNDLKCDGAVSIYPLMVHNVKSALPNLEKSMSKLRTFQQLRQLLKDLKKGVQNIRNSCRLGGFRVELKIGGENIRECMRYLQRITGENNLWQLHDVSSTHLLQLAEIDSIIEVPQSHYFKQLELMIDLADRHWRGRNETAIPHYTKNAVYDLINAIGFTKPNWYKAKYGVDYEYWDGLKDIGQMLFSNDGFNGLRVVVVPNDNAPNSPQTDPDRLYRVEEVTTQVLIDENIEDMIRRIKWGNHSKHKEMFTCLGKETGRMLKAFRSKKEGAKYLIEQFGDNWSDKVKLTDD